MIRHSPAERYFKYMIAHPKLYENDAIRLYATQLNLDYLGDWYVQELRDRVLAPAPFYPEDQSHRASQRFLLKEGLHRIFNPDSDMQVAYRILNHARRREVVETMLLSRAPYEAVIHALRVRYQMNVTVGAVRLFKHYFWDVDLLDSVQMRALLDMRNHGLLASEDKDTQSQFLALRRMRHTDPRVVAARLPSSPLAATLAQMEIGVLPKRVNLAELVERTMEIAVLKTYEAVVQGGPQGVQMGQGYAVIADVMNRLKESVVKPEEKLREDLKKISLSTTTKRVPSLNQLTAGNHTTNVHPEPAAETEVVEATFVEGDENEQS